MPKVLISDKMSPLAAEIVVGVDCGDHRHFGTFWNIGHPDGDVHQCRFGITSILLRCRQVDLDEVLGRSTPVVGARFGQLAAPSGHIESHGVTLLQRNLPPLPVAEAVAVTRALDTPDAGEQHEQNDDDGGRPERQIQLQLFPSAIGRILDQLRLDRFAHVRTTHGCAMSLTMLCESKSSDAEVQDTMPDMRCIPLDLDKALHGHRPAVHLAQFVHDGITPRLLLATGRIAVQVQPATLGLERRQRQRRDAFTISLVDGAIEGRSTQTQPSVR